MMKKISEKLFYSENTDGVTLVELLIAVFILSFGLLAAAQLLAMTLRLDALSRLKSTSVPAAQNEIERLADLYRRNPASEELTVGTHHAKELIEIRNPATQNVLNRYKITWTVGGIPDPRPGVDLPCRTISVRAIPMLTEREENPNLFHNKATTLNAVIAGAPQ